MLSMPRAIDVYVKLGKANRLFSFCAAYYLDRHQNQAETHFSGFIQRKCSEKPGLMAIFAELPEIDRNLNASWNDFARVPLHPVISFVIVPNSAPIPCLAQPIDCSVLHLLKQIDARNFKAPKVS